MSRWKPILWRSAAIAVAAGIGACGAGDDTPDVGQTGAAPAETDQASPSAAPAAGGEQGEAGVANVYDGLAGDARTAQRLTHLEGFLLIAQRLAEEGDSAGARVLVQQGVLEVYDVAPSEYGVLDITRVRAAGAGDGDAKAGLAAAVGAIEAARAGLEYNGADTVARMTDIASGIYRFVAVDGGVDPVEYQHSLGAALAARAALVAEERELKRADARAYRAALAELDRLIALWPAATAPESPTPYRDVLAQASRVRLELSPFLD